MAPKCNALSVQTPHSQHLKILVLPTQTPPLVQRTFRPNTSFSTPCKFSAKKDGRNSSTTSYSICRYPRQSSLISSVDSPVACAIPPKCNALSIQTPHSQYLVNSVQKEMAESPRPPHIAYPEALRSELLDLRMELFRILVINPLQLIRRTNSEPCLFWYRPESRRLLRK